MSSGFARVGYLRRVAAAYLGGGTSQLTFWHEHPEVNSAASMDELGPYYMTFADKARYLGPFDEAGIPLLDYHGDIGLQYNPIAIAQYGLAHHNAMAKSPDSRERFLAIAGYMRDSLRPNAAGFSVWMHDFDWEYRDRLIAPWYSGLAQGQGISLLVRAHAESGDASFLEAAERAFLALKAPVSDGGCLDLDPAGMSWIEEYIVDPPTHILNGFMWGLWGVWDHWLATREPDVKILFDRCVETLLKNLHRYDIGFWSLYEQSGTRLPMIASPFYHSLHIVQLEVMFRLTGHESFRMWAERWRSYQRSRVNRTRALAQKIAFKLLYY
jgi:heparosan-N-sulfate-glucuronate 5-epimerase